MKTEKNCQKSWFQECFKNFGCGCFFFKSNKKYYGSAALFLRRHCQESCLIPGRNELYKALQRNLLNRAISFVYLSCKHVNPEGAGMVVWKRKKIVLIETDNSFCHREIFNNIMGFKENKRGFNILTLQLLPLLALCKP